MANLEILRPIKKQLVIDVVDAAGISTDDWKGNDDPSRRSNWCFGAAGQPNVAFVWFDSLDNMGEQIFFTNKAGSWADQYRREGEHLRAKRADAFDRLILQSYYQKKSIRVAIVAGDNYGTSKER